jgi:hypothetical protein
VVVAVADTGANVLHPDFVNRLSTGHYNFVANNTNVTDDAIAIHYHGSNVAGIIGAQGNNRDVPGSNGGYMTGVAWDVSLLILKVMDLNGGGDSDRFARGIDYAYSPNGNPPAIAINCSWGILPASSTLDKALYDAVERARANNMVVVAAAGNQGLNCDNSQNNQLVSPASIPKDNVIAVGATRVLDDTKPAFSNYGKYRVELGAPGGEDYPDDYTFGILGLTQDPNSNPPYTKISGTSQAAPHVTGALALVKSEYPWEDYAGIRDRVIMGTDDVYDLRPDGPTPFRTGGRLNLHKALQKRTLIKNLSTRAKVESDDRIIIGAFTIRGTPCGGPFQPNCLKVVIRGIGPSLAAFGVANPLPDPELVLNRSDGKQISFNEDWQDDPVQAAELTALGFAPGDEREAALVQALAPGSYTVLLRSQQQGQEGVGTFEIYEIRGNTTEQTRLVHLFTRCLVGTGDEVAIAGTILQNPGPTPWPKRRILAFGRGPSLPLLGLTGTLPDPYLEFRNGAGGLIDSNDQWKDIDGSSTGLQQKLYEQPVPGFMPGPNPGVEQYENESALWPTLQTGSYTAILKDAHDADGIGLIEFYEY